MDSIINEYHGENRKKEESDKTAKTEEQSFVFVIFGIWKVKSSVSQSARI